MNWHTYAPLDAPNRQPVTVRSRYTRMSVPAKRQLAVLSPPAFSSQVETCASVQKRNSQLDTPTRRLVLFESPSNP